MYFPISHTELAVLPLILIGFTAGATSAFWGVGGGWIIVPAFFILGLPMNFAVGTSLAFITSSALFSTLRHKKLGNVDVKLGLLLVAGKIPGVEIGVIAVEYLKNTGNLSSIISIIYLLLLGFISFMVFYETFKTSRKNQYIEKNTSESPLIFGIGQKIHSFRMPPFISSPVPGVDSFSIWVVIVIGVISGLLSGLLGIGGSVIMLPLIFYVIGLPTHIGVGTSLLTVLIAGLYGTFSHALKGNVDISVAFIALIGAVLGTQIGGIATSVVNDIRIRFLFGVGIAGCFLSIVLKLFNLTALSTVLILGLSGILSLLITSYFVKSFTKS
ncbi:MAG TPA: sulfite exporter TauE/SafE family protein [Candidatus Omnitrophica bacterium]|nr:sulfite exporter TauE/SafE family protein [Candidatus Omnitrophota bacterium]